MGTNDGTQDVARQPDFDSIVKDGLRHYLKEIAGYYEVRTSVDENTVEVYVTVHLAEQPWRDRHIFEASLERPHLSKPSVYEFLANSIKKHLLQHVVGKRVLCD